MSQLALQIFVSALLVLLATIFLRLVYILPCIRPTRPPPHKPGTPTRLVVVLGSGGHTTEMFALLRYLNLDRYGHRTYVVSAGDDFSAGRARDFEASLEGDYDICTVTRARRIHQSLWSTPISALQCLFACFGVLRCRAHALQYPDVILTNGPGTAVCVIVAALMLRFIDSRSSRGKLRTIYVESFARVKTLSLSGKLVYWLVDRFLVQWEELKKFGRRTEYYGVLVA